RSGVGERVDMAGAIVTLLVLFVLGTIGSWFLGGFTLHPGSGVCGPVVGSRGAVRRGFGPGLRPGPARLTRGFRDGLDRRSFGAVLGPGDRFGLGRGSLAFPEPVLARVRSEERRVGRRERAVRARQKYKRTTRE